MCWKKDGLIKGIVQPKMKILSSFTYPHIVPNLYDFFCKTQKNTFGKKCLKCCFGTQCSLKYLSMPSLNCHLTMGTQMTLGAMLSGAICPC